MTHRRLRSVATRRRQRRRCHVLGAYPGIVGVRSPSESLSEPELKPGLHQMTAPRRTEVEDHPVGHPA